MVHSSNNQNALIDKESHYLQKKHMYLHHLFGSSLKHFTVGWSASALHLLVVLHATGLVGVVQGGQAKGYVCLKEAA